MRIETRAGFGRHSHDYWEIVLWQSGKATHFINDEEISLSPYDLFLLRPDDVHAIKVLGGGTFTNVAFETEFWERFCALAGLDAELRAWKSHNVPIHWNDALLTMAFSRITAAFATLPAPGTVGSDELALVQFLGEVSACYRATQQASGLSELPDWLRRARVAMDEEENLRGGVPRLLQIAHVSPGHLSRAWKTSFGQHPTDWVNAKRLELAAALLHETHLPIDAIAARAGFQNLTYFYRLFTGRYGRAPRAYRLKSRTAIVP